MIWPWFAVIVFDPVITIGLILNFLIITVAIVGGWYRLKNETQSLRTEIDRMQSTVEEFKVSCAQCHFPEFARRIEQVYLDHDRRIVSIETLMPKLHEQQAQLRSIESWLKRINDKLDR